MDREEGAHEDRTNGFAGRLDVIEGPSGRRSWPDALKVQIVHESFEPGVTVSEIARRHRISPQHLTLWRRAAREGRLSIPIEGQESGGVSFVPLAVDDGRLDPQSLGDAVYMIEIGKLVLKLPGATPAGRIAEIIAALEVRR